MTHFKSRFPAFLPISLTFLLAASVSADSQTSNVLNELLIAQGKMRLEGTIENTCAAEQNPQGEAIARYWVDFEVTELEQTEDCTSGDDAEKKYNISGKIYDSFGYLGVFSRNFDDHNSDWEEDQNDDKRRFFNIVTNLTQNGTLYGNDAGKYKVKFRLTFNEENGVLNHEHSLDSLVCLSQASTERIVVVVGVERDPFEVQAIQAAFDKLKEADPPINIQYVAAYDPQTDDANYADTVSPERGPPYIGQGYGLLEDGFRLINDVVADIVFAPQPSAIGVAAKKGNIYPLSESVDAFVSDPEKFSQEFVDSAKYANVRYGVPVKADLKSLLFYRKDVFDAEGYEVPDTFEKLVGLTEKMVEDGYTPWCIGIESGYATGWVFTDWVEERVLGSSPEVYDDWVTNDLAGGFTNENIVSAWEDTLNLWKLPGAVYNPTLDNDVSQDDREIGSAILQNNFFQSAFHLAGVKDFGEDGIPIFVESKCLMHRQASFIDFLPGLAAFNPFGNYQIAITVFPGDASTRSTLLGAGVFATAVKNGVSEKVDSEVEAALRFFASVDYVNRRLEFQGGEGFLSPNKLVDLAPFNEIRTQIQQIINAADLKFDASDSMPQRVGAVSISPVFGPPGGFWGEGAKAVVGEGMLTQLYGLEVDGKSSICAVHAIQEAFCSVDDPGAACPAPQTPAECTSDKDGGDEEEEVAQAKNVSENSSQAGALPIANSLGGGCSSTTGLDFAIITPVFMFLVMALRFLRKREN